MSEQQENSSESSFTAQLLIINELKRIKNEFLKNNLSNTLPSSAGTDSQFSTNSEQDYEITELFVQFLSNEMKLKHAVNVTVHNKYPTRLICLHYNQTRANFENSITKACRGVIVDLAAMKIVHMPFSKFFNFNEPMAIKDSALISQHFSSKKVKVYEKFDGSIVNFYFFDGEWRVASSSTPDGSARMGFYSISKDQEENERHRQQSKSFVFADLVWNAFHNLGFQLPSKEFEGKYSFTFELLTQKHPLVVQHPADKDNLILHGVRCLETFSEQPIETIAKQFNWNCASCVKERFKFSSLNDVYQMANERNPYEHEGFVVCYENGVNSPPSATSSEEEAVESVSSSFDFIRVKIKNAEYVKISLALFDSVEKRENSFIEIIKKNESSEFLAYFPQFESAFKKLKLEYDSLVEKLNNIRNLIDSKVEELVNRETDPKNVNSTRLKALQSTCIQQVRNDLKFSKTVADVMFSLCGTNNSSSSRQPTQEQVILVEDILKNMPLKRYKTLLQ